MEGMHHATRRVRRAKEGSRNICDELDLFSCSVCLLPTAFSLVSLFQVSRDAAAILGCTEEADLA